MIHNNSGLSSNQNIDNKNIWLLFYQIVLQSLHKMEEFSSIFPYLGEDMVQQTLANFAQSMQKCFAPGTEGFNSLAETTQKLKAKREQWPQKIFQL